MPFVLVGLDPAVLALLAAILAIAATFLIRAIANSLPAVNLPIIGNVDFLARAFTSIVGKVEGWAVDQGKQFFHLIAAWILGHEYLIRNLAYEMVNAVTHVGSQIAHLYTVTIPNAIDTARNAAAQALAAEASTLRGDISTAASAARIDAENYADNAVNAAESVAAKATRELSVTIGGQLSSLTDTVRGNLKTAEDFATAAANTAAAAATATLNHEIAGVQSTVTTLSGTVASDLTAAERYAAAQAQAAQGAAIGTLEDVLGGVYTDLTGAAAAVGGDLTSLEALLAGAITLPLAAVLARVIKLEKCSVGVCDDSPNNFSSLLQAVLGVATFAELAPFLKDAIENPASGEGAYASVVQGLYTGGHSLFDSLLSL